MFYGKAALASCSGIEMCTVHEGVKVSTLVAQLYKDFFIFLKLNDDAFAWLIDG